MFYITSEKLILHFAGTQEVNAVSSNNLPGN